MKSLVLLVFHYTDAAAQRLERYLRARGFNVTVIAIAPLNFVKTGQYRDETAACARHYKTTPLGAWARREGVNLDGFDAIGLISWSAGSGAVRPILDCPEDAARISVVVGLDTVYADHDGDGTASDEGVRPWVQFGRLAVEGQVALGLAYTDIATPYASTSETAREIARLLALALDEHGDLDARGLQIVHWPGRLKRDHIEARDGQDPEGDSFVRAVLELLDLGQDAGPATLRYPSSSPTSSEPPEGDAQELPPHLAAARADLAAGVREVPGPAAHPAIAESLEDCVRGHAFVFGLGRGSDETENCASMLSARWIWGSAFPGRPERRRRAKAYDPSRRREDEPPVGPRCAVRELCNDARATGTLRGPDYDSKQGDVIIMGRLVDGKLEDPTKGGRGHVGVDTGERRGGRLVLVEANHHDAVEEVERERREVLAVIVVG